MVSFCPQLWHYMKAVRNAKGHNRDMPDVLACQTTTLNCELIKVDTGTCKTSNSREKKNVLTCRGEEVVLDRQ